MSQPIPPDDQQATPSTATPPTTYNMMVGIDAIPVYDGHGSIDEFLGIIEETATVAQWTEGQKVAITRLKLRDRAKQLIASDPTLQTTKFWNELKTELKTQFTRPCVKGTAIRSFIECRQRPNETCRQFLTRLKLLGNKTVTWMGDVAKDEVLKMKLDQDICTQFTLGLTAPLKQRVLSGNPTDLKAALEIAEREESIEYMLKSANRECRAVHAPTASRDTIRRCFNCQKQGHYQKDCWKKKQSTCYTCNRPGHLSSNCFQNPRGNTRNSTQPRERQFTSNQRQQDRQNKLCFHCRQPGHVIRYCPNRSGNTETNQGALNANAANFAPRGTAANEASWE